MIDLEKNDEEDRLVKLRAFSGTLVVKRKQAIDARKRSGIEETWRRLSDNYNGIDDANRHLAMLKPATTDGRVTWREPDEGSGRSTIFPNITQPYCDMAAARVADMLLPTSDIPFSFDNSPIPDLAKAIHSQQPYTMPDGTQKKVGDVAQEEIDKAKDKADKAETQVWDWLVESRWHSEMRSVIEQSAQLGAACLKGPFPVKRKSRKATMTPEGMVLEIHDEKKPAVKMIDVRNIFPAPGCGNNIHNGSYLFEYETLTARQLMDLRGTGYIDSEIDAVIKEGPGKRNRLKESEQVTLEDDLFEVWHYYGSATKDELEAANCSCEKEEMPVIVSMVNDRVIKASLNVLDSGEFPHEIIVWQKRHGYWAGIGVAEQIETAQDMLKAATRNLMDNAGVSAGPQIVIDREMLEPAVLGDWTISPLKIWFTTDGADLKNVRDAITSIVIPSLQVELMNIIKLALEFAERATSMPLLLQGQQGAATDKVGGMEILQNNANTVLRRIAKIFDDAIERLIGRFYEWLMVYSDNEDAKGDFNIITHGSSSFYERDAQNQVIMQLLQFTGNPQFGLDPDKLMVEVLKMNKISPDRVRFSDEEIEQQKEALKKNPPQDPRLQAAQLKAQADMAVEQLRQKSDMQELQVKGQMNQSEIATKLHMIELEFEHQKEMKQLDVQLQVMKLSQEQQISIESIKAQLAGLSLKLNVQQQLSSDAQTHDHIKTIEANKPTLTPPVEPAGRAAPGHAWEQ